MALVCIRTCLVETTGIPFSFAFGTCFDRFPCCLKIVWFTVGWIRSLQSVVLDGFHHQSSIIANSLQRSRSVKITAPPILGASCYILYTKCKKNMFLFEGSKCIVWVFRRKTLKSQVQAAKNKVLEKTSLTATVFRSVAEQRITCMLITNPGQPYWNVQKIPWIHCWFLILPSSFLHFALESSVPYFIDRYSDMEAWRDLSGF